MTNVVEVRLRDLYREYVQLGEIERAEMEKRFFEYYLTARPLRPSHAAGCPFTRDVRFRRIYDFLAKKGYFDDRLQWFKPFLKKLNLKDFLWSCENVDARLYQLLPAVYLRFPMHFKNNVCIPSDLQEVLSNLSQGLESGPDYHDYPFKLLKSWLWFQPNDVRCNKVPGTRLSVRLDPEATRILDEHCQMVKITRSEAIHKAIKSLAFDPL